MAGHIPTFRSGNARCLNCDKELFPWHLGEECEGKNIFEPSSRSAEDQPKAVEEGDE